MNERKEDRKPGKKSRHTEETLERSGMRIKQRDREDKTDVYEVEPQDCPGRRVVAFDHEDDGLRVGVQVPLAQGSELRGESPNSDRALLVQGILSAGLQHHRLQVEPLSGDEGLEGFLLTFHLCEGSRESLKTRHAQVDAIAHELSEAFERKGEDFLPHLKASVGFRAYVHEFTAPRAQAIIVPTFDQAARDRMMQKASGE